MKVTDYFKLENRFRMLTKSDPKAARKYFEQAQLDVETRWQLFSILERVRPGHGKQHRRRAELQPRKERTMNLKTTYLGLKLRTPLVVSASPLSENLDNIKRMEDAGASAVVFHSLFEEQLRYERYELHHQHEQGHGGLTPKR